MNWLTTLGFAVLLLSLHCNSVQSKKHSSHVSKSPWADPVKAKAFMDCLIKKIEQSDVIPQQEKQDMESLVQSLMSALAGGNTKGNNSKATLQAMNMAFASALAELVVAEGADDPDGIEVKTNALINILQQCFKKTMHKVDKKFIYEIKDLIQMFVKEAAEEMNEAEDNEFPEDYSYNLEFQTNDQASKDTYITNYQLQQSSGQYPDEGKWGPSGSPSDSSSGAGMTPERLLSSMGDSQVIGSMCRGIKSPVQIKGAFTQALIPALQIVMRLDGNSASSLASIATNGMMSLPSGSSPRDYLRVLLTGPLAGKLRESRMLETPGSLKLFLQTLYGGLIKVAANYGVIIPRDAADKDVASATTSMTTTITSIQTSFDSQPSGEYPGGQYPDDSKLEGSDFTSGGGDFAGSLNNILNSRNGLKSPEANLRINNLTSALQQAIGDDGIKPSVLSSVLRASFSKLRNSGMSSDKATIESLMELITALVHVVGSSRPDPMKSVALSSSIGFTTSLADALY